MRDSVTLTGLHIWVKSSEFCYYEKMDMWAKNKCFKIPNQQMFGV